MNMSNILDHFALLWRFLDNDSEAGPLPKVTMERSDSSVLPVEVMMLVSV